MKFIDITREIRTGMAVYPGDPEVLIKKISSIPEKSCNVSMLSMGAHTGTHVDSFLHIKNNEQGVDGIPLEKCYGGCVVIDLSSIPFGSGIEEEHLKNYPIKEGDIVLIKTKNSSLELDVFKKDFVFLANSGAEFLVKKNVKAVGVDYLSVAGFGLSKPSSHEILIPKGIIVYEGLDLSKAKEGKYLFIGFPIKIKEGDGAPVRAVLIEKD